MSMNRFSIGDRVWHVVYECYGLRVRKCLVVGINTFLTDVGQAGVIEKAIQAIEYVLFPITKDPDDDSEFLWDEESRIKASGKRIFEDKEDAFHFIDCELIELRKELENEY